ncbi:MAG: hypothetical protein KJZ55_09755, partial [Flavobacteriales bacterium]|nr:hypothetical protein [Flavobacteriales bacterium]
EFSKVKKYLGDKYANRVDSLDKDRLDDIIGKLNYIEKVTFSKATIRESIKWSNQSLKIAIYFKNDEVKKKIEERLDFLKKEYSKWI